MNKSQEKAIRAASAEWTAEYLKEKLQEMTQRIDVRKMDNQLDAEYLAQLDQNIPELKKDKLIHTPLDNQSKVIYAKRIITSNGQLRTAFPALYDDICKKISNIEAEYKWCNSKRGRNIIQVEDWIDNAREQQPANIRQQELVIGRNASDDDPCNIIIGGVLHDISATEVELFFNSLRPPVRPFYLFISE